MEVCPRSLEARGRGHAGRCKRENSERCVACLLDSPPQALDPADICEFMRVPDDGGHTPSQHRLAVSPWRDHGALDVQVDIDQAGRDDLADGIERCPGVASRPGRMNARDQGAGDPDIRRPYLPGNHVGDASPVQQKVKRLRTPCRVNGPCADIARIQVPRFFRPHPSHSPNKASMQACFTAACRGVGRDLRIAHLARGLETPRRFGRARNRKAPHRRLHR